MATFEKLKQFEPGREAKTVFLLLDVTEKVNRNGGSYCHLLLSDGEEQHTATMWDVKKETYAHFVNNLIECVIKSDVYNNTLRFIVTKIVAAPEEFKVENFIISAPIESDKMYKALLDTAANYDGKDSILYKITENIFEKYKEKLLYWAGAKTIHHNCYGGLLYHLYRMTRMGLVLLKVYPLYKDVLITGIILHDIGKLKELKTSPLGAADFTADGNLFGHVFLGLEMFDEAVSEVKKEFDSISEDDAEKIRLVKHLIASHHGKTEYGAIATPAIPEAMVLNYLDLIDSRMDIYEKNKPSEAGTISERIWSLDGYIYSPALSLPENKNQK